MTTREQNRTRWRRKKGQTLVEYTLLLGIVGTVLVALTPMVRRATQGMVKLVADQVGEQKKAEQSGGTDGYLKSSYSVGRVAQSKRTREWVGSTNYIYDGTGVETTTTSETNMGFSKRSDE
jgi:hypothetical protein